MTLGFSLGYSAKQEWALAQASLASVKCCMDTWAKAHSLACQTPGINAGVSLEN